MTDANPGNSSETTLFNPNHQSNLLILTFKSLIDSSSMDFFRNSNPLLLSYPLKDIPAKLTVDGRRNLLAVVR